CTQGTCVLERGFTSPGTSVSIVERGGRRLDSLANGRVIWLVVGGLGGFRYVWQACAGVCAGGCGARISREGVSRSAPGEGCV
ncbi:MAG TPA: hypothetical protein VGF67_30315, partial [Ktedonobacteraceae bacterium]